MDNQALAQIVCAKASVTNNIYDRHIRRIRMGLHEIYDKYARPPLLYEDPVQWRPREFNTLADALCHLATSTQTTHQTTDNVIYEKIEYVDADFQIFTDGGMEEGGGSAGLAMICWDREDKAVRTLVHCEATAWANDRAIAEPSAFEAEVVALDRAVARKLEMFQTRSLPRTGWASRPNGRPLYCDH